MEFNGELQQLHVMSAFSDGFVTVQQTLKQVSVTAGDWCVTDNKKTD
jgi:hypothetical protein